MSHSTMNQNEAAASLEIEEILGATKPKHLGEGIASGLGYIVRGAIGGVGTAVLLPAVAAAKGHEEKGIIGGILGGVGGVVGGAVHAVNLAGGGVVAGVGQVVQGAAATPKAFMAPRKGMWWNASESRWVSTNLLDEERFMAEVPLYDEDILGEDAVPEEARPEPKSGKKVKETMLYDRLGLDPSVDKTIIKRRYYIIARKYSPDRAGANDAANEEFRDIGKAYMILMNDGLREKYDRVGYAKLWEEENEDELDIDPMLLYTFLFGSEKFNDYIGRLASVTESRVGDANSSKITLEQARLLQQRRVTRLAIKLADRLSKWAEDDLHLAAKAAWQAEAHLLCDASYGIELVRVIGKVYTLAAVQFMGSIESGVGMPSISQWAKKQAHSFKARTSKVVQNVKDIGGDQDRLALKKNVEMAVDKSEGSRLAERRAKEILRESMLQDSALRVLWRQTVVDITSTVHEVCQMVLHDLNVSIETRQARAKGLEELGKIFEGAEVNVNLAPPEQESLEELAFHAMLDTVWRQEVSARTADC